MNRSSEEPYAHGTGPLVTLSVHQLLTAARQAGTANVGCSLDLGRTIEQVDLDANGWHWRGHIFPHLQTCKERTIYHWTGATFEPVARFGSSLIKLVPTQWGAPTFEIDGIKMLPSEHLSPYTDAQRKVDLIRPQGKVVLDTCGGLGYFAAWCLERGVAQLLSYEKNADVLWLRDLNPWSPRTDSRLTLTHGDIVQHIATLPAASVDAALHDPPRFGIAGELYSQAFYLELARVLKHRGQLFHYVGSPNKLTTGRDVPREVMRRLELAGFSTRAIADGVLAVKRER
jgi:uncharacterized protein